MTARCLSPSFVARLNARIVSSASRRSAFPKSQSVTPPAADVILFSQLSTLGIYILISILYYELIHNPNHGI